MDRLAVAGPIVVEPVSVGIFLKRARSFAELRPRDRWVNAYFSVPYPISSPRIQSRLKAGPNRVYYVVRLHSPVDVDDELTQWLLDAYAESPS
jgi:hypothetical protein